MYVCVGTYLGVHKIYYRYIIFCIDKERYS